MKTIKGFLSLLLMIAFFIGASSVAVAERSVGQTAESWATDPKTGCQVCWAADTNTIIAATWSGPKVNNKAEGKGMLTLTLRATDGREVKGEGEVEMKAGKLDGKGTIKWSDGKSYEGDYKEGKRCGKGIMKWPNGGTYEGDWENDTANGQGRLEAFKGDIYDGGWKAGKRDGKCVYKMANGTVYEGDAKSDKLVGKGKITYPNGSVYEGDVDGCKPSGHGILKDPSGKVLYEGESKNASEQF